MLPRRMPILGQNLPGEQTCTRIVNDDGICGKPGLYHLVWLDNFSSFSCESCAEYADRNVVFRSIHPKTEHCLTPQAKFYSRENTCRVPVSTEDYDQGETVFDD